MSSLAGHRRLLLAAVVLVAAGCGDDDSSPGPSGPDGPPSLRLAALRPAGRAVVTLPASGTPCLEPGEDVAGSVDVELAPIPNFTFAAPGGAVFSCKGSDPCGFVVLTVSAPGRSSTRVVMTGPSVAVPVRTLATAGVTQLTFHAELFLSATNGPLLAEDGGTYTDSAEVRLAPSCGPDAGQPDGGSPDATPGDAGDAGIPGSDAADAGDSGAPPDDAGDAGTAPGDAGDAGDAASDGGDAASDGGRDASSDAAPDAPGTADAAPDAPQDARPDADGSAPDAALRDASGD